jgi:hypothetical protein
MLRGNSRGWGYRKLGTPSVEPTALASLGLTASGNDESRTEDAATLDAAAGWRRALQRADGSLPVAERLSSPGWATPYALLLWNASRGHEPARAKSSHHAPRDEHEHARAKSSHHAPRDEHEHARAQALGWLLRTQGHTLPRSDASQAEIGHDSTAIGWPWVADTHSWLEPTALAIVALCREGQARHPRVTKGIELLLDRSLKGGGWNYGNKSVFGRDLRPQPGPTGLALVALAARGEHSPEAMRALGYLRDTLPRVRAGVSLGWGTLGLRAYDAAPGEAETWLAESYRQSAGRPDAVLCLALLLLAASPEGMGLLIDTRADGTANRRQSELPRDDRSESSR